MLSGQLLKFLAMAKSAKAAPCIAQLRAGLSLLRLCLTQEFAEYILEYEVSTISRVSSLRLWTGLSVDVSELCMRQYLEAGRAHGDGGVGQQRAVELPAQRARPALHQHVPAAHGAQHSAAHHHGHELGASLLHHTRSAKITVTNCQALQHVSVALRSKVKFNKDANTELA